jgi:hypothetical protein
VVFRMDCSEDVLSVARILRSFVVYLFLSFPLSVLHKARYERSQRQDSARERRLHMGFGSFLLGSLTVSIFRAKMGSMRLHFAAQIRHAEFVIGLLAHGAVVVGYALCALHVHVAVLVEQGLVGMHRLHQSDEHRVRIQRYLLFDYALDVDGAIGEERRFHLQRGREFQPSDRDLVFFAPGHDADVIHERGLSRRGNVDHELAASMNERMGITARANRNRQTWWFGGARDDTVAGHHVRLVSAGGDQYHRYRIQCGVWCDNTFRHYTFVLIPSKVVIEAGFLLQGCGSEKEAILERVK